MGDIMLLIERWIATMPFQTSRRKIQDSEASQKVAGGGVGRGLEGHEARAEAENQYDVRRKERGEELKRAEKRRRDCQFTSLTTRGTSQPWRWFRRPSAVIN